MNRTAAAPPSSSTQPPSGTMDNQNGVGSSIDIQNQMIQKFSQQSGMNFDFSKLLVVMLFFKYIYLLFYFQL